MLGSNFSLPCRPIMARRRANVAYKYPTRIELRTTFSKEG